MSKRKSSREDDKDGAAAIITDILKPYKKNSISCDKLQKKPNTRNNEFFCNVNLPDGKFILRKIEFTAYIHNQIYLIREYHILKNLQEINSSIICPVDLKWVNVDGKQIFEMLIENPGEQIKKSVLKKMEGKDKSVKIAYQLAKILEDLERVGVSHFNIKPQ